MINRCEVLYGPEPSACDLDPTYDVCVVGSGAAGATVAWLCARAGLSVVVVEQGGHVSDGISYDDVLASAELAWVRQENGTWGKNGYPWTTCNVGGGTLFYGGALFRYRPVDFDPRVALGQTELPLRWPWDHAELDPYYTAIEQIVGVAGEADADPTLPPRGAPYPLPPVPRSLEGAVVAAGARALGWHPFATPLAVNTRDHGGRASCRADAPCITRRCPIGAKGDALSRFLEPAMRAGARLFAGLKAVRLHSDGRVATELECVRMDTGARYAFRARRFAVCANAVQSAALLLRSRSDKYPNGLGNTSDFVGRGLCFKLSGYVVGYRQAPEDPVDPGSGVMGLGPFSTCAVTDLYEQPAAPGGLGGLLYEARPERTYHLRRGEQLVRIEVLVPDEPQGGNRVRLGSRCDAHGVPDLVLDYRANPRDLARLEYMLGRGEELLRAADCHITVREESGWAMGSCHLHGTCRMGSDPLTSVTDPDGRLHDTENVYIGDGALFPFPGGANPTLTIQATALRTARRMLYCDFGIALSLEDLLEKAPAAEPLAAARSDASRLCGSAPASFPALA
jgi:choline dehydrogenase-like flavoprotein